MSVPNPPTSAPLDAVVIGAGQAGLAVGYYLARSGARFLIVDAGTELGHVWRSRWDSLTLFTPAEYCSLPGMPFPAPASTYPTKDQVADYLTAYAERFQLPVMLHTTVRRLTASQDLFHLDTNQGVLTARQVIVATGPFQTPSIPNMSANFTGVTQLHSSDYRNPAGLPSGRVLVVGSGNSGLQIAHELATTHDVHVALGTKQTMVPQRPLGRDLFWWLTKTGILTRPATSPIARAFRRRGGDLVIGTHTSTLQAAGVSLHPRLIRAQGGTAYFADDTSLDIDTIVWATGFRPDYSWIDIPGVWDGRTINHTRGRTDVPGLSFIGLPWQHTRGSALLGFVQHDAHWLTAQLSQVRREPTLMRDREPNPGASAR